MSQTYSKTRTLVECALMIALGTVLANIKIYSLANGGSVTLFSMLPFSNKLVGVGVGTAVVCFIRFMCSFLSGVLIWGNLSDGLPAWTYSLTYNGSYMLPETIMTTVAAVLIYKAAPQLFSAQND